MPEVEFQKTKLAEEQYILIFILSALPIMNRISLHAEKLKFPTVISIKKGKVIIERIVIATLLCG